MSLIYINAFLIKTSLQSLNVVVCAMDFYMVDEKPVVLYGWGSESITNFQGKLNSVDAA